MLQVSPVLKQWDSVLVNSPSTLPTASMIFALSASLLQTEEYQAFYLPLKGKVPHHQEAIFIMCTVS